jgi:peroxiredoxin family protein
MSTHAKQEQSGLPENIELLIDQHVEALVKERLETLVKERVAQALKRDPARRKVAIMASKGTLDMAYPPLFLATTAAAMDAEVQIYFTLYGLNILKRGGPEKLQVAPIANPAMPVPIPNILGMLPGMTPISLPDTFVRVEKSPKSVKQKSTAALFFGTEDSGKGQLGGERDAVYPEARAVRGGKCLCRGDHGGQSGRVGRDGCTRPPNVPPTKPPERVRAASGPDGLAP